MATSEPQLRPDMSQTRLGSRHPPHISRTHPRAPHGAHDPPTAHRLRSTFPGTRPYSAAGSVSVSGGLALSRLGCWPRPRFHATTVEALRRTGSAPALRGTVTAQLIDDVSVRARLHPASAPGEMPGPGPVRNNGSSSHRVANTPPSSRMPTLEEVSEARCRLQYSPDDGRSPG